MEEEDGEDGEDGGEAFNVSGLNCGSSTVVSGVEVVGLDRGFIGCIGVNSGGFIWGSGVWFCLVLGRCSVLGGLLGRREVVLGGGAVVGGGGGTNLGGPLLPVIGGDGLLGGVEKVLSESSELDELFDKG